MNPPTRPAVRTQDALKPCLWLPALAVLLALLFASSANAQDATPAQGNEATDLPYVTNVIEPAGDPTLGERFDGTLNAINGVVFGTLFRDVSFGAFQHTVTDDQGNVVYEDEPAKETAKAQFQAYLTTKSGQPILDAQGNPRIVTVKQGDTYQPVPEIGKPLRRLKDPKTAKVEGPTAPFLVVFLAAGAIFFTLWHGFINVRGFKHAIDIVRGKFSSSNDAGDIPPFRALTSALSATVGLGNIAGVAIAVKLGGPGAIFWMMFLGLFGMTAKFHESTLAQMFRIKNDDGTVSGGPMYVLDQGFKRINGGVGVVGKVLAVIFAVFCMCAALGGGNMFQSNQAFEGFYSQFVESDSLAETKREELPITVLRPLLRDNQLEAEAKRNGVAADKGGLVGLPLSEVRERLDEQRVRAVLLPSQIELVLPADEVDQDAAARSTLKGRVSVGFGLIFATLVAIVVVGGITRIGAATSKIVPAMCLLYVAGCLVVIVFNIQQIPSHIGLVFSDAFAKDSAYGGLVGVLIIGFQRAAFSSEAGLGSSAIAHSAAQQSEPVREGFVASLEPFIDTIVICFMTAMVVLITDAYQAPELVEEANGSKVTLFAFEQTRLGDFFPYILSVSIVLFAFSTMIAWCYYGERSWGYLFGLKTVVIFRLIFVACVFVGAVASLGPVIDFADAMLLTMALPNIIGGVVLAGLVRRELKAYWARYKSGEARGPADTEGPGAGI
ncbi:MAG: alanine/glycine:cation symporter family protein [Phycisphaeraceae bacterium]